MWPHLRLAHHNPLWGGGRRIGRAGGMDEIAAEACLRYLKASLTVQYCRYRKAGRGMGGG